LLVARGHVQEGRERAERPLRARAQERARAVLAGQTQLERLDPRGEGRTVPLGRLELALELGDALACGLEPLTRLLVGLVEVLLALLDARDLGLEGREVLRGAVSALLGLGEGRSQPAHLGLGRLEARTLRGDLTCEPGKSLATVRDGPQRVREQPLGLGRLALRGRPVLDRRLERRARLPGLVLEL